MVNDTVSFIPVIFIVLIISIITVLFSGISSSYMESISYTLEESMEDYQEVSAGLAAINQAPYGKMIFDTDIRFSESDTDFCEIEFSDGFDTYLFYVAEMDECGEEGERSIDHFFIDKSENNVGTDRVGIFGTVREEG